MKYCDVVVDISHEKLDKSFQYKIPEELSDVLIEGMQVVIPFGRGSREITGFVVGLSDKPKFDPSKTKEVIGIVNNSTSIDSELIKLAGWMKRNYGSTMNQALKTVIPIKEKSKAVVKKTVVLNLSEDELNAEYTTLMARSRHSVSKERLFLALMENDEIPWEVVTKKLNVGSSVIRDFEKNGFITIRHENTYRNPINHLHGKEKKLSLNPEQEAICSKFRKDYSAGDFGTYLVYGVTGSGKTLCYLEMIEHVLSKGKSAIVLIPEIALTYQTVMRFYKRFGDKVSILNSRMSKAERFDQFERARNGDIKIIVGPRSALFTPFPDLGLIVIDEEHESSYKSDNVPKYHAVNTAIERANIAGASVILGSATPSVDSYMKALSGEYRLLRLPNRASTDSMASCEIVDMRKELRSGNTSIISRRLHELIEDRINRHEQVMLFLNRRGMLGCLSCRECGTTLKCPHCDVSLSLHRDGKMHCHYCGYTIVKPKVCGKCGSKAIGGFNIGTEKVEELVAEEFPGAKVLRMDMDTTKGKSGHEEILEKFANREADILVGTQMIVKGHDFSNVTLVGALAADMSLNIPDYRSGERTFQLLTQAVGRAGRGHLRGDAIIQTYEPENYSIVASKEQDYESFYNQEIVYRKLMNYPPAAHMLLLSIQSEVEEQADGMAKELADLINTHYEKVRILGPQDAAIAKINDVYRKTIYIKDKDYGLLVSIKDLIDEFLLDNSKYPKSYVYFDFDPIHMM